MIQYRAKLTDQEYYKKTCGCSTEANQTFPQNIMLFISTLSSVNWDQTGKALKNLFNANTRVGEMSLTTIVLSVNNFGKSLHSGIQNYFISFVKAHNNNDNDSLLSRMIPPKLVEKNNGINIELGCQVDVSYPALMEISEGIISHTERKCQPILHVSKLVVWQIDVSDRFISAFNFSFDFETGSLKRGLFRMLAERDIYKRRKPDKEVMFSIVTRDLIGVQNCSECSGNFKDDENEREFRQSIAIWARIHQVRVIFKPMFDLKNNINGMLTSPRQNLDGSFDQCSGYDL